MRSVGKEPVLRRHDVRAKFNGAEPTGREPRLKQAKVFDGGVLALTDAESFCTFGLTDAILGRGKIERAHIRHEEVAAFGG